MAVNCLHDAALFFASLRISLWSKVRSENESVDEWKWESLPVDDGNLRFRDIQTRDGMIAGLVCVRAMQLPENEIHVNFPQLFFSLFLLRSLCSSSVLTCCRWQRSAVPSWQCSLVVRVLRRCPKTRWWLPGRHRPSRCGGTWKVFHFRRFDEPIASRQFELPEMKQKVWETW